MQKRRHEFEMKEEQLVKRRETELKHIRDIKEHYDRRLERVNQLYLELSAALLQLEQQKQECRKRELIQHKRKLIHPFMKKFERRRSSHHSSTTPTSPEHSLTSPESPEVVSNYGTHFKLTSPNNSSVW